MTFRIIGGSFKGRLLVSPKGSKTRPTQGVVREALFNICQDRVQGAFILDLFAGTGAIGLEGISRGASMAVFVEKDRQAIHTLEENIKTLNVEAKTKVIKLPVERALKQLKGMVFHLIYIDPPYGTPLKEIVQEIVSESLLTEDGALFIEEGKPLHFEGLKLIKSRKFGAAFLSEFTLSNESL